MSASAEEASEGSAPGPSSDAAPPPAASPADPKPRKPRSLVTNLAEENGSNNNNAFYRTRRSSSSHSEKRLSAPPSPLSSPRFTGRKSPAFGASGSNPARTVKRHSIDWSGEPIDGSPPFSSTYHHASPGRPPPTGSKGFQSQHPPRFWEDHLGTSMHNSIRDLLHNNNGNGGTSSPSSNNSGSKTPGSPRSASPSPTAPESPNGAHSPLPPPPGALAAGNALFSPPHALLRQASLASLAPPELSLHNVPPDLSDIDAKWPDPPLPSSSSSPPLEPLVMPEARGPVSFNMSSSPQRESFLTEQRQSPTTHSWSLQQARSPHRKSLSLDAGSPSNSSSDDNAAGGGLTVPRPSGSALFPSRLSTSPSSPSAASDLWGGRSRSHSQPNPTPTPTRRRKRSSRSSISSIGSGSSTSSNSRWSENEDTSMDGGGGGGLLQPASPPTVPRTPQPHLAMPERSGWEYGDDDDDDDDDEDDDSATGSDVDADSSDQDAHSETEDNEPHHIERSHLAFRHSNKGSSSNRSAEPHNHHHHQQQRPSVPTPAAEAGDIDFLPEQLQYTDIDQPPPPPTFDAPAQPPPLPHSSHSLLQTTGSMSEDEGEGDDDDDDESLSVLERIFILSKSEYREHRLSVTKALPDWLGEVDICEAAEYVLPLLNGLASDDDEVKVGLAQGLDRLMYYFFSSCPLADDDGSKGGNSGSFGSRHHRRDPSDSMRRGSVSEFSELVQPMELDEIEQQPQPSGGAKTSRMAMRTDSDDDEVEEEKEVIDPPHISAGAFTPILGLLLMEPNIEVSSWARAAVVRFLCRINDKDIPTAFQDESAAAAVTSNKSSVSPKRTFDPETGEHRSMPSREHYHKQYTLTDAARQALEQQILVDVVLGLARLESGDDDSDITDQLSQHGGSSTRRPSLNGDEREGGRHNQSSAFPGNDDLRHDDWDMHAEDARDEHQARSSDDAHDEWASVDQNTTSASPDWGMSLRSFQPVMAAASTSLGSSASYGSSTSMSFGERDFYGMSAFDGDTEVEDEATQGKIASLELVSAIALSQCLPEQQVADAFLPEVKKMVEDPAPRVRGIAASALGPLAKALPHELATTLLVTLMEEFAADSLPMVRRWACLTLPDIFGRLPAQVRFDKVVAATAHFSQDTSRDVRSALTEICGPLIHLFKDEEVGVPSELLDWYLGKPSGVEPAALLPDLPAAAPFAPLPTALSALTSPTQSNGPSHHPKVPSFAQLGHPTDPERAMICAYNLPAVVLTLGSSRWHEVRDFYLALTNAKPIGIRRSLAASLHAIVDVIGPEQAGQDLVSVAVNFLLFEEAREVREMVLEHFVELVLGLPLESGARCLAAFHEAISSQTSSQSSISWRAKEKAAGQMSALAAHFASSQRYPDLPAPFLDLLHTLLKDEVAAVRAASVKAIPAVFEAILKPQSRETKSSLRLIAFLTESFARDASYRHRCTFITCVSALMLESDQSEPLKDLFSQHFLVSLGDLAKDAVVNVRMAVARLIRALVSTDGLYKPPAPRPAGLDVVYKDLSGDSDSTVRDLLGDGLDQVFRVKPSSPLPLVASTSEGHPTASEGLLELGRGNSLGAPSPSALSSSMAVDSEHLTSASMATPTSAPSNTSRRHSSRESTPGDDYFDADDCGLSSSTLTDLTALGSNDIDEVLAAGSGGSERPLSNGHHSPRPSGPVRLSSFDRTEQGVTYNRTPPSLNRKLSYPASSNNGSSSFTTTTSPPPAAPPLRPTYSEPKLQGWSPPDEDFVRVDN